jgi:hypothetical protein
MLCYQSSPFTGKNIPVYRTTHPPLQEKISPFPGGIIPVSRRERETTSPFTGDCNKVGVFKVLYHHFPPCEQTIIPISRRNHPISRRIGSPCSGGLIAPFPFTGKSIIPVSRITEKKYIPLRKHPRFQDGSMGLTINYPKITLTHGDDYPTLSWDDYPEQGEL